MRIPPGLLNALQGTARETREGQDSRPQGQPDSEAARSFDRLFQTALREPARDAMRERVREPMREPVREPVRDEVREPTREPQRETQRDPQREPLREQVRAPERAADRNTAAGAAQAERQDQRARQDADSQRTANESTDGGADAASTRQHAVRGARSQADDAAQARTASVGDTTDSAAQASSGVQLTLDAALLPQAAQAAPQLLDDLQAASAALLQAARGLTAVQAEAAAGAEATEAVGNAKAAPVAKHIEMDTSTAPASKDSKDAKDAKDGKHTTAADLLALPGATEDAQARTGVRDRLLEDFERRFERSLAAAAGGAREGFTPGTPQALAALATAATGTPQPTYSSAHAGITTPLTHPGFGDELSNRVVLFAGQRVQNAELAVTPADLGPIKVSIELRGQEATLAFTAQHATTRAAIEDALPRLREMFADQGLQLAQAHVGDQRRQDSGRYGGQREGTRGIDGVDGRGARPSTIGAGGTGGLPNAYGVRGIGLIDIHV